MPTAITLPLAPVTKQFDCGMYRVGSVSAFLLVIGVWFCHWPCHLMVDTWHLVMKMALSWCGTSQVAAAYRLWWDTIHVYGHLPSGANPRHFTRFPKHFLDLIKFYLLIARLLTQSAILLCQLWKFPSCFWFGWLYCKIMGCNYKYKAGKDRRKVRFPVEVAHNMFLFSWRLQYVFLVISKSGNTHRLRFLKTLPTKSTPVSTLRVTRPNAQILRLDFLPYLCLLILVFQYITFVPYSRNSFRVGISFSLLEPSLEVSDHY